MLIRLFRRIYFGYSTKWVCPKCGCELPYGGEGNMRCPHCGAWMEDE